MLDGADGPCTGCRHFDRCTTEKLACEQLLIFARHDRCTPARWLAAPKQPNRDAMARLMAMARANRKVEPDLKNRQ